MNWLLLRGLIREQRHWKSFPEVFSDAMGAAKVVCLDHVGIGTERHRPAPRSVQAMATDLRERWLALKDAHPGDWGLFAVSLGGMVSLTWCHDHPEDFARLVVCNSSANNLSPLFHRFRLQNAAMIPRMFVLRNPIERERAILTATTSGRTAIDEIAIENSQFALDLPTLRRTGLTQLYAGSRCAVKPDLKTPMLVLNSHGDRLVDPRCSERIAEFYRAPLVSHDWGGHDLPLEDPAWVGEQVRRWLAESDNQVPVQ